MDRLITLEPSNTIPITIEPGQKNHGQITLRNVMYTMPVAFRLQPLIKMRYTVKPQTGIISPLSTITVEIIYHLPQGSNLPHSFPYSEDSFLLHSVVVPGATIKESSFESVPSDWFTTKKKQVFIDTAIKIIFVGPTILAQLVLDGPMDEIRDVLEKCDPNAVNSVDSQGHTLLHLAISQNRPDIVQLLLEFKPDLEAKNRSGLTPLELACSLGEGLIVELLLARGSVPESSPCAIHLAARAGHVEVLRLLLLKGARVESLTKDGNTALHLAVEERRRDCVRLLLANGARTDVKNLVNGDTALHVAVATGEDTMVNLLLQKGANKEVRNLLGKTAYDVAAENGHRGMFDALRFGDSLCVAARKGEVRVIERLVESGADVNGRDQNRWTALHRACFKGRMDAVRVLIEKGVDVDAKDVDGYTAWHCAVESGNADVAEVLVKKGADLEARTAKGVTALQIAESLNYVVIVRMLRNGGASKGLELEPVISVGSKMEALKMKRKSEIGRRRKSTEIRGSFDRSILPLAVL